MEKTTFSVGVKPQEDEIMAQNPFTRWPRNLSCFCGSSEKFKKCCEHEIPRAVPAKHFAHLKKDYDKLLSHVEELKRQGLVYFNTQTRDEIKGR